ncbi:FUSC family protein [Steroidobacter sp.]|uniref:FUSC family protein n=1 Tax=Steroidobacter sp. TaxID=1978227 RepID=UPI001A487064|nr:FUSC family protein [Steroidobacter sp.]MBL8266514.1 FUSC family protein [Steroidobacter sp.]
MNSSTPKRASAAQQVLRGMFEMRPGPEGRWLFSLRAAACMGAPILTGWLANDTAAGLMASIGGFTALYGSGRPYVSRAIKLAMIALAFALSVALGLLAAPMGWAVIVVVAAIAMIATWLSNALQIGPPGAYMFALACAAGTAMPAAHIGPLGAALLVFGGGAFAWLLHMAGALFSLHGPERGAVRTAGRAVIGYINAIGTDQENVSRYRAAYALHAAWTVLVNRQPTRISADSPIARLRALNRELHLRFAEAMGAASRNQSPPPELIDELRKLIEQVHRPEQPPVTAKDAIPLGHPSATAAMLEALQPGSNSMRVIVRVGVAALVAGAITSIFHFERAYWAVAATVLMLHQGFDWLRMLQRSLERLLGTWVGLLLTGAILVFHPQGVWLVLVVMACQFTVEMLVIRNYALAAVFITGGALTIAAGGHPVEDLGGYLWARGIDTLFGCFIALVVFRLIPPRATATYIPEQLIRALHAVAKVTSLLAQGVVTTPDARMSRRELQLASFALTHAYEDSLAAARSQRFAAEQLWPIIAAVERLAYRTISTCWALEQQGAAAPREAAAMFGADGAARVSQAIDEFIAAISNHAAVPPLSALPQVLETELVDLQRVLQAARISEQH